MEQYRNPMSKGSSIYPNLQSQDGSSGQPSFSQQNWMGPPSSFTAQPPPSAQPVGMKYQMPTPSAPVSESRFTPQTPIQADKEDASKVVQQFVPPQVQAQQPQPQTRRKRTNVNPDIIMGGPADKKTWVPAFFGKKQANTIDEAISIGMTLMDIRDKFGDGPDKDIFGICSSYNVTPADFKAGGYASFQVSHLLTFQECIQLGFTEKDIAPPNVKSTWKLIAITSAFDDLSWVDLLINLSIPLADAEKYGITSSILRGEQLDPGKAFALKLNLAAITTYKLSPSDIRKIFQFATWEHLNKCVPITVDHLESLEEFGWTDGHISEAFPDFISDHVAVSYKSRSSLPKPKQSESKTPEPVVEQSSITRTPITRTPRKK